MSAHEPSRIEALVDALEARAGRIAARRIEPTRCGRSHPRPRINKRIGGAIQSS